MFTASTAKEIRPLVNHTHFVSGHFLVITTEIFEYCEKIKYEIANLLAMA
jgi:hypothetical protein